MSVGLFVPDLNDLLAFGADAGLLTVPLFTVTPVDTLTFLSGILYLTGDLDLAGFFLAAVFLFTDPIVRPLVVALYLGVEVFFALGFDDAEEVLAFTFGDFFLFIVPIIPERLLGFFLLLLLFVFL
tara:strand:- start:556 stop:933 length:378 start_codon:yes stop_codon:yes gene_type:complete